MSRKTLFIIVAVFAAAAFSLVAIAFFGFEKIEFGDTQDYVNAANSFLNGTPYPRRSIAHPMFRPPLFPALVAAVWSVFPESVVAVKLFQTLLHAATVFVVFKIVYEVLRKEIPAFFGALICAVNPLLAAHTVDFFTEPLHTFLCALAMYALLKFLKTENFLYQWAILTGAVFGLATLCRPAILGVAVCLFAVVALVQFLEKKTIERLVLPVVMMGSLLLTVAPWTLQNYRDTSEFILVNDGFSYNLWLGNLPETIELYEGEFKTKEENQRFADRVWGEVQQAKLAELEQKDNYSQLGFNEREKIWRREAVAELTQDYGLTARLVFGKTLAFWTPFLNHFTYGKKTVWLVAAFVIGIYILGAYGARVFALDKTGRKFVILLAVTFVVTTAIHALIFGFVRYRVPNVDPYLSMLAGVAIWRIAVKMFPRFEFLQN